MSFQCPVLTGFNKKVLPINLKAVFYELDLFDHHWIQYGFSTSK
jgi:hypothetical protein